MKIILYENGGRLKYNPNTAKNKGIGSLQSSLIELSREFAKRGHDVTCFVRCNTPDLYDGVKYYDVSSYEMEPVDLFIGFESFPKEVTASKVVNWVHRSTAAEAYPDVDKIILASAWQKNYLVKEGLSEELIEKVVVIPSGVNLELFSQPDIEKREFSIVHTAFPTKGMVYLKDIFPRIRERIPKAELHVYSGGGLWGWEDKQFRKMYNDMIKARILFHGQLGRENLARQLNMFKVFLYPCTFEETFCLTILEAMAAGCVPITTSIADLPNIVENGKTGYIVEGNPKDYMWQHHAADMVQELLTNSKKFITMSDAARVFASQFTWEKTAKEFEGLV